MDTSKQVSVPAPAPQAPPATPAPAAPPASAAPAPLDFINKSSGGGMGFSKPMKSRPSIPDNVVLSLGWCSVALRESPEGSLLKPSRDVTSGKRFEPVFDVLVCIPDDATSIGSILWLMVTGGDTVDWIWRSGSEGRPNSPSSSFVGALFLLLGFIVPFVFNNNLNAGNDVEDFFSKYMAAQLLHYVCSDIRKFVELVLGGVQKFACDNQAKSDDVLIVKLPET
ncbi:hypothetical protein OOU_Y34scaffold00838g4 [Pyricularia oryzae Y34]|uniref:Uncharacterized protein n=2 Tax=Pyricularia oryzae TaxID=318829 RepID=A0AA97NPJ9_PYRO3|nr:hypothetical protein OOU_Y34scaffold00838g4 [Pyricularia oryzae Y34]